MNQEALEAWLVQAIEEWTGCSNPRIDVPFADLGVDSSSAVTIAGELEKLLSRRIDPTILWDFPTIEALAAHLTQAG